MSPSDIAKEEIAYAKFWLGAMAGIGLLLLLWWLSSAYTSSMLFQIGCAAAMLAIVAGILLLHRRIMRVILELKDL
jgi:hypothetical protein